MPRPAGSIRALSSRLGAAPSQKMNKRIFISFGLVALLLVIVIPFWAFSKDGSDSSSPEKVAASDDAARALFQTNCGSCHTLARAGTDGVVGPNLDERLAAGSIAPPEQAPSRRPSHGS